MGDGKIIPKIKDNKDKASTYKKLMERYTDAYKNGYYLECLVLDYAMIEDRMNRLVCTLGIAKYGEEGLEICSEYKESVNIILKKEPDKYIDMLTMISQKRNIVIRLLKGKGDDIPEMSHMKGCLERAENGVKMVKYLNKTLQSWLAKRNQLIHAMFNKQYDAAMEQLPAMVEEGRKYADTINNYARRLKTQLNRYTKESGEA